MAPVTPPAARSGSSPGLSAKTIPMRSKQRSRSLSPTIAMSSPSVGPWAQSNRSRSNSPALSEGGIGRPPLPPSPSPRRVASPVHVHAAAEASASVRNSSGGVTRIVAEAAASSTTASVRIA
eukprot:4602096-Pyramimonas_sp.AAC.1